ncbi:MAG: hypothetical protein IRZ11_05060 [Clostridia bacterium]|nr:hypothetical protein [Clostridia bacterium]
MPFGLSLLAQEESKAVWGIFTAGQAGAFVAVAIFAILVYVMITRARAGQSIREIHKIPGLDAISEAVGRATEMGRPVHYTMGLPSITDPQTIAAFPVLGYVAKLCAQYETRLINTVPDVVIYAINEEIIRQAYLEAGRPDAFNPDDVRFITDWQFAYVAGVLEILAAEKPAAQILFAGPFYAEAMIFIEAGALAGAIQVGGTASTAQLPFFVAGCDYALIGEEIYAASAYLSKEPIITGTVVGEDYFKFLIFAAIIVGTLIATFATSNPLATFMTS